MAVHAVISGQAPASGIDQPVGMAARTDAAEQIIFRGIRTDERRLVRRSYAIAVRQEHGSRGFGVVAVEQILHGEHGFLCERRPGVPPAKHRAAVVRTAAHGNVCKRAVGQLHAPNIGALRMTDHSEHALGFQIGLQAGIADAVRAVLADQPAVRIQHRNAGQPQPLRILPQLVLAAVKRHALQFLNGGRSAHERLGHGGLVILHIGGGLLLYKVDQFGHALLAVPHIRVPGQQEYRAEEQKPRCEAQAPERPS